MTGNYIQPTGSINISIIYGTCTLSSTTVSNECSLSYKCTDLGQYISIFLFACSFLGIFSYNYIFISTILNIRRTGIPGHCISLNKETGISRKLFLY